MSLLNRAGRTIATRRGERAGRPAVPQRQAGQPATASGLPRADRVGAADGALDAAGAAEHGRLRPGDPLQRLRLSDHPRRHEARRSTCIRRRTWRSALPDGVALPPVPTGPDADADRVLGLRLRQPGRAAERHRDPRQPDGLHGRRREHARHRLLGRRVRLLRAAAEPRRLRRDRDDRPPAVGAAQQGRDDGHLLRRDQPALHRADQPAEPGRDLAALGARRHADDALSGRHPQHRLRGRLGQGADPRGQAGAADQAGSPGPTSGSRRATRPARPTRCCTARRRT